MIINHLLPLIISINYLLPTVTIITAPHMIISLSYTMSSITSISLYSTTSLTSISSTSIISSTNSSYPYSAYLSLY